MSSLPYSVTHTNLGSLLFFRVFIFQNVTDAVWITDIVWTYDSKLLQESNLIAKQPRRVPHHVIQATASEGLAQGPYMVAKVGFEPATLLIEGTEPCIPLSHHAPLWRMSLPDVRNWKCWLWDMFLHRCCSFAYLYSAFSRRLVGQFEWPSTACVVPFSEHVHSAFMGVTCDIVHTCLYMI